MAKHCLQCTIIFRKDFCYFTSCDAQCAQKACILLCPKKLKDYHLKEYLNNYNWNIFPVQFEKNKKQTKQNQKKVINSKKLEVSNCGKQNLNVLEN